MQEFTKARELLDSWTTNPEEFHNQGYAYDLLQEFFKGFSTKTLIPLLNSSDSLILQNVCWIISELGEVSSLQFLDQMIDLSRHKSAMVRFYSVECIFLGTYSARHDEFYHVIRAVYDSESSIRIRAVDLISKANNTQIRSTISVISDEDMHLKDGLESLINPYDLAQTTFEAMISHPIQQVRLIGMAVAQKVFPQNDNMVFVALESDDPEVKKIAELIVKLH